MPLVDIFKKDRKHWQHSQNEEVELFFLLSPFFNRYYQHQNFDNVVALIFYSKIQPNRHLSLQLSKKSQIIILLTGQIQIFRKGLNKELRKKSNKNQGHSTPESYIKIGQYGTQMQTIQIKNEVVVKSQGQKGAEILFVPTQLFQKYAQTVLNRRIQTILDLLSRKFEHIEKKYLRILASKSCKVRQFKMNSYIYRVGGIPEYCYIIISGSVKTETPGFSAKKMLQMAIVGQNAIFGQKDLNQDTRQQNAICCSAYCKVLQIQKEPYNKFILAHQQANPTYALKLKTLLTSRASQHSSDGHYQQPLVLPKLQRFHSFVKPQQQEIIEKQIAENCHILIQLSPKRRRSAFSFRSPQHSERDYSINPFNVKMKLFYQRKKNVKPFDLQNKMF